MSVERLGRGGHRLRVALALLAVVIFAVLWTMRVELASGYIDRELARRGVTATYRVKKIGFGSEVFENLMIGDPRHPDLTARHVEIGIRLGLRGPYLGPIVARGVRMRGRLADGRLSLGEIDKLLPPRGDGSFRLPDKAVDIEDAAIELETPAGEIALALAGRGNLAGGFRGGLGIVAGELRLGGCALARPVARFSLLIENERPHLRGLATAAAIDCRGSLSARRPLLALTAMLTPALEGWRGAGPLRAAAVRLGGRTLGHLEGHARFRGASHGG